MKYKDFVFGRVLFCCIRYCIKISYYFPDKKKFDLVKVEKCNLGVIRQNKTIDIIVFLLYNAYKTYQSYRN